MGTDLLARVNLIMDPFCVRFKGENPSLLITKGKEFLALFPHRAIGH